MSGGNRPRAVCLLQRAAPTQPVKPQYVSFTQPTVHTQHVHITTHSNIEKHIYSSSGMYTCFSQLHPEFRMSQLKLKHTFHTHALFHIHIIGHITSITMMVLLSLKNIFLIRFNYA